MVAWAYRLESDGCWLHSRAKCCYSNKWLSHNSLQSVSKSLHNRHWLASFWKRWHKDFFLLLKAFEGKKISIFPKLRDREEKRLEGIAWKCSQLCFLGGELTSYLFIFFLFGYFSELSMMVLVFWLGKNTLINWPFPKAVQAVFLVKGRHCIRTTTK